MMTVSNQNINLESLPSAMELFQSHSNDFVASPTSFQSLSSSSLWLSQQQEVATSSASTSFEAVPPDTTTLIGMGAVFVLCVIAAFVWNNSVVPVSRTKLAISKSRGEVRACCDTRMFHTRKGSFVFERNTLQQKFHHNNVLTYLFYRLLDSAVCFASLVGWVDGWLCI